MQWNKVLNGSASVLALTLATGTAYAQDASSQVMETVTVTGVRASLQSAQEIKKNSSQMVDSIVSEDIGKLPDNNVIEALQHVTGIQIARNTAETNQLLIRGLPDIATLLNGREMFTSTGRFVTLQDIPAELLARVDVQKSSEANDLEGGIAGLIDVRLHRPFDFDGLQVAGGLRGIDQSLSKHIDPSASLLISNRWQTSSGEFGLLFDISYSKRHYKQEILDNYISTQGLGPVAGSTGAGGTAFIPLTEGAQSIPGSRERGAVDISAQWRPNVNTEFYAEMFYTRYRNPNSVDFFVGLPWICADASTATVFPGTNEVKTVTGGCYEIASNQSFRPKTDTMQLSTGGSWTGDNLTLTSEINYTDSRFAQTGYILDTHYWPDVYTADFNYKGTGTPYMNVTGPVTDPANQVMRQWYDQWTKQTGNEIDWRGDLSYDMGDSGFFKSIDGGVRYANRFAKNRQDNYSGLDCDSFPDPASPLYAQQVARDGSQACGNYHGNPGPGVTLADIPGSYHTTGGNIFDGNFGIKKWTDANPEYLVQHVGDVRALFGQPTTAPAADPAQSFDDREVSYAGYIKANFAFANVDGNVGVRLVDTEATFKANTLVVTDHGSSVTPEFTFAYTATTTNKSTLDWMPSLNARVKLQDDLFLRLAASRTVTRPTFIQLDPALSLSASTATLLGSGSAGNPNLSPVKSDNADLSLEYYFGPSNVVTGAVFYRQVDGYIVPAVAAQTIGGITYQVTSYANAPSGHIEGLEVGYTQFFDFLPGIWSGLGVQANGTYVDGAFANISKYSYNVVGIYEYGSFSFRAAYNWRDGFDVGPAPGGGQNPSEIYAKAQPWLDLSASYTVNENLTFTFDATNLLDSYYQDSFGKGALGAVYPRDTRRFDQTLEFGLRYKM